MVSRAVGGTDFVFPGGRFIPLAGPKGRGEDIKSSRATRKRRKLSKKKAVLLFERRRKKGGGILPGWRGEEIYFYEKKEACKHKGKGEEQKKKK